MLLGPAARRSSPAMSKATFLPHIVASLPHMTAPSSSPPKCIWRSPSDNSVNCAEAHRIRRILSLDSRGKQSTQKQQHPHSAFSICSLCNPTNIPTSCRSLPLWLQLHAPQPPLWLLCCSRQPWAPTCRRMGPLMTTAGPCLPRFLYSIMAIMTSSGADCSQACSTRRLNLKFSVCVEEQQRQQCGTADAAYTSAQPQRSQSSKITERASSSVEPGGMQATSTATPVAANPLEVDMSLAGTCPCAVLPLHHVPFLLLLLLLLSW